MTISIGLAKNWPLIAQSHYFLLHCWRIFRKVIFYIPSVSFHHLLFNQQFQKSYLDHSKEKEQNWVQSENFDIWVFIIFGFCYKQFLKERLGSNRLCLNPILTPFFLVIPIFLSYQALRCLTIHSWGCSYTLVYGFL